jgi:hypothetical protein
MTTMPTSSKNWFVILISAFALAALAVAAVEMRYRKHGLLPSVLDDKDLWAQERQRLASAGDRGVALIGTSRMLFGIDPKRLKARLGNYQPIMLAVNGAYPLATLDELANDASFRGIVIIDVDAEGLSRRFYDMQQPQIDHYYKDFGPSRALHRRILTQWQRRMVVADPSYGLVAMLQRRLFGQAPPQPRYAVVQPNRAGALDFQRIDPEPLRAHFANMKREGLKISPPDKPEKWLADLQPIQTAVKKIQDRGGQVMFFCSPTRGEHLAADLIGYPRQQYWDQAAQIIGAPMVYADDVPIIRALNAPDGSHVDAKDRDQLTDGLYQAMRERLRLN